MSIFVTGGTGFVGSYIVPELLARSDERLVLLVRAADRTAAVQKLWKTLQLNVNASSYAGALSRIDFVCGDLHAPDLGLSEADSKLVQRDCRSIVHVAASLNRRSDKVCFNTNLRGTLSVVRLAMKLADSRRGLRRYTHVSTVAVAGLRRGEVVQEDTAIDWDRSDYDPYARTKKFAEHMAMELLPGVSKLFLRPSIVLGDSHQARTSQFDMVRAFCGLADLPLVPLRPDTRLDIVSADFVGAAVAAMHLLESPRHQRYHLASGRDAVTARGIGEAMGAAGRPLRFSARLNGPFGRLVRAGTFLPKGNFARDVANLMDVFWPYVTFDTVFDNERIIAETGLRPTPFTSYCAGLYTWAKANHFEFPVSPLPVGAA